MIIHNYEQRSEQWYHCRKGKLTGSNANTIAVAGKGLETYCYQVLAEKYAIIHEEGYTNEHIQRGIELEAHARTLFELQTGKTVTEVGFIEYNDYIGASPDGLITEENAIIEIKCPENKKYFRFLLHGESEIEKSHLYQMQMEMLCANATHGYYLAFNPNFEKSLFVHRVEKDQKIQDEILAGCEKGKAILDELEKKLV